MLYPDLLPSLFDIPHHARRNVVVAPGRILGTSDLVSAVLVRPALNIVVPGVAVLVPQTRFSMVALVGLMLWFFFLRER